MSDGNGAPVFTRIAPIPDEAINELGEEDRTAILLRFSEEQNFQSVGQVLGSGHDKIMAGSLILLAS